MNNRNQFEQTMHDYFGEKRAPSPETKEKIRAKLLLQEKKRNAKQLWFVALGVAVFTIIIFLFIYTFASSMIALCVSAVNIPLSVCGSVLLIVVSNKEKIGGNRDVVLD